MKKRGRPTSFTQAVASEFCQRLSDGRSLRSITQDDDMPSWSTLWRWLQASDEFRAQYARAREIQAHFVAQEAIDEALSAKDPQLGRLAFDARKWFASKLAPKVYGEKIDLSGAIRVAATDVGDDELLHIARGSGGGTAAPSEDEA